MNILKNSIIVLLISIPSFLYSQNNDSEYKKWKHFEIFCDSRNDSVFTLIQDILKFDTKYEFYSLRIDIRNPIEQEQFIYLVGDYVFQPEKRKWLWIELPISYQNYLIEYKPDIIIKKELPE